MIENKIEQNISHSCLQYSFVYYMNRQWKLRNTSFGKNVKKREYQFSENLEYFGFS